MHHFVLTNDLAQVISEIPLLLMDSELVLWYIYIVQLHMVLNLICCHQRLASDMLETLLIASLFCLHCIFCCFVA
jgi:hypothetical protein